MRRHGLQEGETGIKGTGRNSVSVLRSGGRRGQGRVRMGSLVRVIEGWARRLGPRGGCIGRLPPFGGDGVRYAQSASDHSRRRQPPGRGGDHPLLFQARAERPLDAVQDRRGAEGALRDRPVQDVRINQCRRSPRRHRRRKRGDQPRRLRGQPQGQGRAAPERNAVEGRAAPFAAAVQADVQRIIEIYRRSGRFDISVDPKIIELPNNRVDLVFEINEGDKTGVKKIDFVGNSAYSDYRLKDVIKTSRADWLSWIKKHRFLRCRPSRGGPRPVCESSTSRTAMRTSGWFRRWRSSIRPEGLRRHVHDRRGDAISLRQRRYPFQHWQCRSECAAFKAADGSGGVYNADAIDKTVEDLTIDIARRGYPFALVRPRGDRNFEAHRVDLAFLIDEGPHAYIERINIRGNTRTRDYVIRREFDIAEGDAYNRALIDRAERRLKNLNYFKVVKITNEPGSAPDRIIINVDVEEQSTGEFSFSGGYLDRRTACSVKFPSASAICSAAAKASAQRCSTARAREVSISRSSSRISSATAWRLGSTSSTGRR